MPKTATLKLETLHLIPGLKDFQLHLERPGLVDGGPRAAVGDERFDLPVEVIEPHPQDAEDVWISPIITSKRPATKIDPVRGRRTRTGQLQFDFADDLEE
jgi:hypothetical protein